MENKNKNYELLFHNAIQVTSQNKKLDKLVLELSALINVSNDILSAIMDSNSRESQLADIYLTELQQMKIEFQSNFDAQRREQKELKKTFSDISKNLKQVIGEEFCFLLTIL